MPKSRGRQPRRSGKARAGSGDPRRREAEAVIAEIERPAAAALNRALGGNLSDPVTLISLPARFLDLTVAGHDMPAERCVDDCLVLASAYAQLGITAEVRIAELTVPQPGTGGRVVNGSLEPYWEDDMLHGHTVVWLPGHRCLVDPTAEQYEGLDLYGEGTVIAVADQPDDDQTRAEDDAAGIIRVRAERGPLRLAYVLGTREASAAVLDHPYVHGNRDGYLRRGINVASEVLARLVKQRPARDTDMIPFPRMAALANALRNLRRCQDDDGNICFARRGPGGHAVMRLDQIPLPPGVPSPGQVG